MAEKAPMVFCYVLYVDKGLLFHFFCIVFCRLFLGKWMFTTFRIIPQVSNINNSYWMIVEHTANILLQGFIESDCVTPTHSWKRSRTQKLMQRNVSAWQDVLCAMFDLQQVVYLSISMEHPHFSKKHLTYAHNLTSYNVANEGCGCLTWHYHQSKCRSLESYTALYTALKAHYQARRSSPRLNKNSIVPTNMFSLSLCLPFYLSKVFQTLSREDW